MSTLSKWIWIVLLGCAFLLLVPVAASGQAEAGALYGTVSDTDGEPLPGASVSLSGMGADKMQISDTLAKFRFLKLSPGVYDLAAHLDGFAALEYPRISIRAGRSTTLELELTSALEEVISVTAESPLLDERKVSQGAIISQLELEVIPTARDPWALLNQAPGVMVDRIDVGGSHIQQSRFTAPGVPLEQNDWVLDGTQITDMYDLGAPVQYFDLDQFSQVELSTGGNDVTKPSAGVSLNLVTKRGTNELRGTARFFLTDEDLFLFFKQSQPDIDPGAFPPGQEGVEGNETEYISDYGFEAGGPAWRDRVWLWGAFGNNQIKERLVGGFEKTSDAESQAFKLNAQLAQANSLVASWSNNDKQVKDRGLSQFREREAAWFQRGPTALIRLEDSHILRADLLLTGSWSKTDAGWSLTANGCIAAGGCDSALEWLWDADFVQKNSNQSGSIHGPGQEWKLDGSYFFSTGRTSQELKFGGRYRTLEFSSTYHYPGGRDIGHMAGENFGLPTGVGLFFAQRGEGAPVSMEYTSLWLQDTLSRGNWTINAGLRYDHQDGVNEPFAVPANPAVPEYLPALDFQGNDGGDFNFESISPRLGVTYAFGEQRQTLLRASYARFASALGAFGISRLNPVSPVYAYFYFSDDNRNRMWDGREEEFDQAWCDEYDCDDPASLESPNVTDPGLDPEPTDEVVLGVEHAFLPELVTSLSATWRNRSGIFERRALLREVETGLERLALREDYVFDHSDEVVQPDGTPYTVDYYGLSDEFEFTGGDFLINGDRQVEYLGATLSLTKRLSNQWMLRGFIHYGRGEWDIPDSFFEFDDPTDADAWIDGKFDNDGQLWASGAGKWSQLVLHSTWSFNLNGMYQIAPNRPWGFNVAGNVYGREGYPFPLWTRYLAVGTGTGYAQAVEQADDFRYEGVYTVDLRLEKEFAATGNMSLTLSADLFNVFNEGYVLERGGQLNGPRTYWVLETLSPRIWRLGVRLNWR